MTTLSLSLIQSPVRFTVAFVMVNIALAIIGWQNGLDENTWPGWVQGIGSVEAILVAVWVSWHQAEVQRSVEKDNQRVESRRIRLAIQDELGSLAEKFTWAPNVVALLSLPIGEVFDRVIPIPDERFPFYKAIIGRLTVIEDDSLRRGIISAYEASEAMIYAAAQNNRLLIEWREINALVQYQNDDFQRVRYEHQMFVLKESAVVMRVLCDQTIAKVTALLVDLEASMSSDAPRPQT